MSDFLGMFDSEKKDQLNALHATLDADKKRVSDELAYYKAVAKDIKKAKKRVESAQTAYDKRESDKNASRLENANDELAASISSFNESETQIKLLLDTVQADYSKIADMYHGRKSAKIMEAFEKYSSSVLSRSFSENVVLPLPGQPITIIFFIFGSFLPPSRSVAPYDLQNITFINVTVKNVTVG